MRPVPPVVLERARRVHPLMGESPEGEMYGYFQIKGMNIISSGPSDLSDEGAGWEHVSVSLPKRTPTWEEMCFVKDLFWEESECVIQFHPPKRDYVNVHGNCLHLWRNSVGEQEMPPIGCV